MSSSLINLFSIFSRRQATLTFFSAQVAGQLFGALFAVVWWPWIFWSQAIALASLAIFGAWTIPPCPVQPDEIRTDQERSIRERLEALDIPGMLTGVATLVLFNFAWNQAVVVGWQQPSVYVCLILSVPFAVLFCCIEVFWAQSPILPLVAFNSDIAFVFGCTATG